MRTLTEDKFSKVKAGVGSRKDSGKEDLAEAEGSQDKAGSEILSKLSELIAYLKESAGKKTDPQVIIRESPVKNVDSAQREMLSSLQSIDKYLKSQASMQENAHSKMEALMNSISRGEKKSWKVTITKRDSHGLIETFEINQK